MLVCFASEKGGSGKTTLCSLLAERFLELELDVRCADGDRQASLAAQSEQSEGRLPACREVFPRSFPKLARGDDLVLLDLPSGVGPELRAALAVADAVIIPVVPSAYDLRTLPVTLDQVLAAQQARGGDPQVLLIPNKVDLRERNSRKLLEIVTELGWPVTETFLRNRSAYRRIGDASLGALPRSTRRLPAQEVARLADEVLEFLGITEGVLA